MPRRGGIRLSESRQANPTESNQIGSNPNHYPNPNVPNMEKNNKKTSQPDLTQTKSQNQTKPLPHHHKAKSPTFTALGPSGLVAATSEAARHLAKPLSSRALPKAKAPTMVRRTWGDWGGQVLGMWQCKMWYGHVI